MLPIPDVSTYCTQRDEVNVTSEGGERTQATGGGVGCCGPAGSGATNFITAPTKMWSNDHSDPKYTDNQ